MTKRRKNKNSKIKMFGLFLTATGIAVTIAANSASFSGFRASSIEKEISKLSEENMQLELQAARLKSLQSLTSSSFAKEQMVEVTDLRHVSQTKQAEKNQRASIMANP